MLTTHGEEELLELELMGDCELLDEGPEDEEPQDSDEPELLEP